MTKTIFKYSMMEGAVEIETPAGTPTITVEIEMPAGAQILTVQMQSIFPVMWALVDPNAPKVKRKFLVVASGQPLSADPGRYVATFQMENGLVFHVFHKDGEMT